MTTKFKIIFGFVLMIVLTAAMAVIGYVDIEKSSDGFTDYRRQARVNIYVSDMQTALARAVSNSYDFINSYDEKLMDEADAQIAAYEDLAKNALSETHIEYRQEMLQSLIDRIQPFKDSLAEVRSSTLEIRLQYDQAIRPNVNESLTLLKDLSKNTHDMNNMESLYYVSETYSNFSLCLSSLARFAESFTAEDGEVARERLESMEPYLDRMGGYLLSSEGKRLYAALTAAYEELVAGLGSMLTEADHVRDGMGKLHEIGDSITKDITEFNAQVDSEMRGVGTRVLESNARSQTTMLTISLVGVIIGIVLAMLIIIGIIRVLRDLSNFAGAIAEGNFDYKVRSREKGEIGTVVSAMNRIPEMLGGMVEVATGLANDINIGKLRNRGDVAALPGSFRALGNSINGICNAYTELIDALPVPLMACDKDCTVLFFNKIAQNVVGGDLVSKSCKDILMAPECGTDKCIGKNCVNQKSNINEETYVTPQGNRMVVSVSAIPLTDMQGEVAGFIEILTDLTEIRSQQETMMEVARQASEISNRVAAASEELSAQVEQVSRGAEMQRDRVESTASAMTEMNATVLEVARNAGQAAEQSAATREKALTGANLVSQVVGSINQVNTIAQGLQTNMEDLGNQAESIGGVMNVISDIADQTNLLALNAAIEAARAGEAGRGFAVVADEVRKLAEKTMTATHEVGSSITAVQQSARTNIEEVGNAVKSVTEATELANSSGEALQEIVDLASSNSAVVTSIATAAEEQSATSEEINKSIDEINIVVGETTEGMIQSSAAVQELSQMAQELNRVMDQLK